MAQVIRVPELGIAIANVTIVEWLVKEGARVSRGQPLLEVMTDKMVMEVPADAEGILLRVLFGEEAQLTIGVPIAIVGEPGDPVEPHLAEIRAEIEGIPGMIAAEQVGRSSSELPAAANETSKRPSKILASPLAKRLARAEGIDLALVSPTGKGGRITREDVLNYSQQKESAGPTPALIPAQYEEGDEVKIIPFKGISKVIAHNMVRSVQTSAHYSMSVDVDCGDLVALRDKLKEEFKDRHGVDLTYVPFVVKAIAKAVTDHPIVNATIRDENIIVQTVAHVGVAVAQENFIFVPVIRGPAAKTLLQVAQETVRYTQQVRENKLKPEQTRGSTITLTNMGTGVSTYPGLSIINQPEVASVAMGRIMDKVVPFRGQPAIRPVMVVTFTYDHRVVMGLPGGRFADKVKYYLENPELILAS